VKGGIDTSLLDPFTFQNAELDNDNDPWYIAVKPKPQSTVIYVILTIS